jgi:hypothetical protein
MTRAIHFSAVSVFLLALSASAQQAVACGEGNILYEDKMTSADESWGLASDTHSIGPEGMTWTLDPNVTWTTFNQTSLYTDFEVCVKAKMEYPDKSGAYVGVSFWGVDSKNNYTVDLFPSGGAVAVYRAQNGKYLKPVPYFKTDAVKTEQGATNELSFVVVGKHVVITVNGTKVKEFNGIPSADGGLVGLDFGTVSDDSGPTSITYWDFEVREPPPPEEAAPAPSKKKG